jgi:DNA polymerase-3 subunit gamma/tau
MTAYQVLARKYRPADFNALVGQQHVLKALGNALDQGRLHHAYLFTGTRGVGKTTIARIFARALNCEQGVSSSPCGTCEHCVEITQGRFADLIEVDAASRTGVDDTRQLLANAQYAPVKGRYKVYLIDEVHMLSIQSFNALLKTLEEPPGHVKFLLATTDPQKLPVTVLSRCLQFNLSPMAAGQVVGHLQQVLRQEDIAFDEGALWLLAEAGQGSMRDALSLTDQGIAHGGGALRTAEVAAMLGTVDRGQLMDLLAHLVDGDLQAAWADIQTIHSFSPDYAALVRQLLDIFHWMALVQAGLAPATVQGIAPGALARMANRFSAEEVQFFYQLTLEGHKDMARHPSPAAAFEMLVLRLHAFRPAHVPVPEGSQISQGVPEPGPEETSSEKKPEPGAALSQATVPESPGIASPGDWLECIEASSVDGLARDLLLNTCFRSFENDTLQLVIDRSYESMVDDSLVQAMAEGLAPVFGKAVRICFDWADGPGDTAAAEDERRVQATHAAQVKRFCDSAPVQLLIRTFNAVPDRSSIRPVQHTEETP